MSNTERKSKNKRINRLKRLIRHKLIRPRNLLAIFSLFLIIILYISSLNITIIKTKYISAVIIFLIFTTILATVLINVHKKRPIKFIGYVMILSTLLVSVDGIYVLTKTNQFINKSFNSNNKYYQSTYYLLSTKESSDENVIGTVGYFNDMANLEQTLRNINNKYELESKSYKKVNELIDSLQRKELDFIILDKRVYNNLISRYYEEDFKIVDEIDAYNKRKTDTKKIDKFNIYVEIEDEKKNNKYNSIISVNTKKNKASIISVSKDAYIQLNENDNLKDKLENLSFYGDDYKERSLENLLDTNIDYKVRISEKEFLTIIKRLNIKYNNNKIDNKKELEELLNNNKIIYLVDEIYKNIIKRYNPREYTELLEILNSSYETNISKKQIYKIIINKIKLEETYTIKGKEKKEKIYLSDIEDNTEELLEKSVEKARKIITETLN